MTITEYLHLIHGPHIADDVATFSMHLVAIVLIRVFTFHRATCTHELGTVGLISTIVLLVSYPAVTWMPTLLTVVVMHWLHYKYVEGCNKAMKDIYWHMSGARTFHWM